MQPIRYDSRMDRVHQDRLRFDGDAAADIIDAAASMEQRPWFGGADLDRNDLHRIGEELGITPAAIDAAIAQMRCDDRRTGREARRVARRRLRFIRHAMAYVIVITLLALLDAIGGGDWWFFTIAFLWGIVLALHAMRFVTRRNGPVDRMLSSP
jgi:2TM domain